MSIILFALLSMIIGLGGLWFHDVRFPPEGRAERKKWSHSVSIEDTTDHSKDQLVGVHATMR